MLSTELDERPALPRLLPKAVAWAEDMEREIGHEGSAPDDLGIAIARRVGVEYPERIRLAVVDTLPFPSESDLQRAAVAAGLLGPGMIGLTLGNGVWVCRG